MLFRTITTAAIVPLALAGAAAVTAYFVLSRCYGRHETSPPGDAGNRPRHRPRPAQNYVRPAGPDEMSNPPSEGWSDVDEASDESFPASDPPGRY